MFTFLYVYNRMINWDANEYSLLVLFALIVELFVVLLVYKEVSKR